MEIYAIYYPKQLSAIFRFSLQLWADPKVWGDGVGECSLIQTDIFVFSIDSYSVPISEGRSPPGLPCSPFSGERWL